MNRNFHLGHCLRNQSVRVLRATGRGDITRPGDRDWGFSFPVWQSWQVAFSCPFILHFLISPRRFILCVLFFFQHSFIFVFFSYIFILPVFVFRSFARLSFFVFSCLPFRHFFTFPFFIFFFRALCPSLFPFLTFLSFPNQLRSPRRPDLRRNESEGRPSGGSSPGIACREGHLLRGSRRLGRRWDPNVFPVSKIHVFN